MLSLPTSFTCVRCQKEVSTLFNSIDLSSKYCLIIGTPWYCFHCMRDTGQIPISKNTFRLRLLPPNP